MYGKLVLMVGILYVAKNGYYSCITLSYNYIQKVSGCNRGIYFSVLRNSMVKIVTQLYYNYHRVQCGPTTFVGISVQNKETNLGVLGGAPPENFGIFELPRSVLKLFQAIPSS